jgi:hypothetical protein
LCTHRQFRREPPGLPSAGADPSTYLNSKTNSPSPRHGGNAKGRRVLVHAAQGSGSAPGCATREQRLARLRPPSGNSR